MVYGTCTKRVLEPCPQKVSFRILQECLTRCHLTGSVSLLIFFDSTLARRVGPWGCFDGWRYCAQEAVGFWGAAQYAPVVQHKSNAPLLSAPKSGVSLAWETRNVYLYPFMSWYDNDSKIWFKKMYACHRNLNNEHAHKNLKRDKGFFCAQKSQSWQTHIYSYHDMIMTQKVKKKCVGINPKWPVPALYPSPRSCCGAALKRLPRPTWAPHRWMVWYLQRGILAKPLQSMG